MDKELVIYDIDAFLDEAEKKVKNEKQRKRYQTDEQYRQKMLDNHKRWYEKHKDYYRQEEWRAKQRRYKKWWYQKNKERICAKAREKRLRDKAIKEGENRCNIESEVT